MTEPPPKKHIFAGLDIANLGKIRPTRIPTARSASQIQKQKYKVRWRRIVIDASVLAVIVLIAYAYSCMGNFVFNDRYIDKLITIRVTDDGFWSNLILKAITQPFSQPWITAGFAFDVQNFGIEPIWYHIVNIILHFLSCFYFYILVYRLAKRFWSAHFDEEPLHAVPMLAASLLACHPLACESVAHITGRVATITACNFFLALNFFLSGFYSTKIASAIRYYVFTFIFFLLAIFSDCQSMALPIVMFLLIVLLKEKNLSSLEWLKRKWADCIFVAFLAVSVLWSAMHGFTADFSNGFASPFPTSLIYVASQFRALVTYYLRCLFIPIGLSIFPPHTTAHGAFDIFSILGLIVILGGGYYVYKWRKEPFAAFGLALALTSYLAPIFFVQNEIAADRRFYLSIAGLSLVIASKLKFWLSPQQKDNKIRACALLAIASFSALTLARTLDFQTDIDPPLAAKRVNAHDAWAQGALALAFFNEHKILDSISNAKQSIKMNDSCQSAHLALGKAMIPDRNNEPGAISRYKLAKDELEKALSLAKSQHLGPLPLLETQIALASVLVELNEYKEAKTLAVEAIKIYPNSIMVDLIMGRSLNGLGEYLEALRYLDRGFSHDRTNPDYIEPLIEAALGVGTPTTISTAYQIAQMGMRIKQSPKLQVLMARAAFAMTKFGESMRWTDTALRVDPNNPQAIYLRSFQLFVMRQTEEAKKWRERALKLDPDLKTKMRVLVANKQKDSVVDIEKNVEKLLESKSAK